MSTLHFKNFDQNLYLDRQQELFAECFPEVFDKNSTDIKYSKEKYFWQYQSFPAKRRSFEYTAWIENDMVGYYAALPYVYKIGSKNFSSGMVCGVMTSPKHRKHGIFTKLGNFAAEQQQKEDVDFNLTFPIRKAVMPGFIKMGWDTAFEMPLYMKFLKADSLLRKRRLSFLTPLINLPLSLYNSVFTKRSTKGIVTIVYEQFDKIRGYDEFIQTYEIKVPNTLRKDSDFSKWRYGSPEATYLFVCAYRQDRLVGFVSLRPIVREGVPSFGIIDFMSVDNTSLNSLHNEIVTQAKMKNIEAVMTMMSKTSSAKYQMISNGFLRSPFKFHFIIKNLSDRIPKNVFFNEASWHLMFVDTDDL